MITISPIQNLKKRGKRERTENINPRLIFIKKIQLKQQYRIPIQ